MYTYNAKLVRVVDGDTVDLKIDLGFDIWINERVRLKDIDAPEVRTRDLQEKEKGLQAKAFVEEQFKKNGEDVIVHTIYNRGKYGRTIGDVEFDNGSRLSFMLLKTGNARESI
jgi:micrococcal nuclease